MSASVDLVFRPNSPHTFWAESDIPLLNFSFDKANIAQDTNSTGFPLEKVLGVLESNRSALSYGLGQKTTLVLFTVEKFDPEDPKFSIKDPTKNPSFYLCDYNDILFMWDDKFLWVNIDILQNQIVLIGQNFGKTYQTYDYGEKLIENFKTWAVWTIFKDFIAWEIKTAGENGIYFYERDQYHLLFKERAVPGSITLRKYETQLDEVEILTKILFLPPGAAKGPMHYRWSYERFDLVEKTLGPEKENDEEEEEEGKEEEES
jgi:hypothetical protein